MTKSNLVYQFKVAIHYLTEAIEMGYFDATYELAKAHTSLGTWYSEHGGYELSMKFKDSSASAESEGR